MKTHTIKSLLCMMVLQWPLLLAGGCVEERNPYSINAQPTTAPARSTKTRAGAWFADGSDNYASMLELLLTPMVGHDEQYAYTLGMQAYVYGYPWVYLSAMRWQWTTRQLNPMLTPYAAVNHFWHARDMIDASYQGGGAPNIDTLYSIAWVDVTREPVILSVPGMGGRYYAFELASMDSDNFAYVGTRTTGTHAGDYAIIGPGWNGVLPPGVVALERSRTPWVLVFGRTAVNGRADLSTVHALQDQYQLTPLSAWESPDTYLPVSPSVWRPSDPELDPLAEWKTMNRAMTENPPQARDERLVKLLSTINIGPGQYVEQASDATKRGLIRAAVEGQRLLLEMSSSHEVHPRINNWNFPPRALGRAGTVNQYLIRAAVQCLGGIVANDPEESVYISTYLDASGDILDGARRYTLHFSRNQLPKVGAFWTLTAYGRDQNLVDNLINRYSIGDRTPDIKYDPDGGLTLHIQGTSPGPDMESNWLPSVTRGPFFLILRTYIPDKTIVEQTWKVPTAMAR